MALLWAAGPWREELRQLLELLAAHTDHRLHPLPGRCWCHREGVLWHEPSRCNLLFDTLKKSEALFSPSTRYRDLALGPALFHWESQSTTTTASPTEPFVCLG